MSKENPTNREKVSKQVWDKLKLRAEAIMGRVFNVPPAVTNFSHITRNLAFYPENLDDYSPDLDIFNSFSGNLDYLERYLKLIDEFPDFAKKEMLEKEGAFPDIFRINSTARPLVDALEKRLRGEE